MSILDLNEKAALKELEEVKKSNSEISDLNEKFIRDLKVLETEKVEIVKKNQKTEQDYKEELKKAQDYIEMIKSKLESSEKALKELQK